MNAQFYHLSKFDRLQFLTYSINYSVNKYLFYSVIIQDSMHDLKIGNWWFTQEIFISLSVKDRKVNIEQDVFTRYILYQISENTICTHVLLPNFHNNPHNFHNNSSLDHFLNKSHVHDVSIERVYLFYMYSDFCFPVGTLFSCMRFKNATSSFNILHKRFLLVFSDECNQTARVDSWIRM